MDKKKIGFYCCTALIGIACGILAVLSILWGLENMEFFSIPTLAERAVDTVMFWTPIVLLLGATVGECLFGKRRFPVWRWYHHVLTAVISVAGAVLSVLVFIFVSAA